MGRVVVASAICRGVSALGAATAGSMLPGWADNSRSKAEHIAVVSSDVRGIHARKVCFLPATGKALVRRLAPGRAAALVARERRAALGVLPSAAGPVDLF